ncbi:MAG: dihydrodipicolinate synthase family protein, partial [Planctomycetia bacterium]|nr:dihydrodipicolinate synthase family protein [Planctomycetia bacterium]
MPKNRTIQGVLPVFQTPFLDDESIDWDTLAAEIDWIYDQGADGIVMAMVSETLRLSGPEREQLAGQACRLGRPRGVVVVSVGAESTHTAVRFAQQAEAAGADAVMAIPPVASPATDDELSGY